MGTWEERLQGRDQKKQAQAEEARQQLSRKKLEDQGKADEIFERIGAFQILDEIRRDIWHEGVIKKVVERMGMAGDGVEVYGVSLVAEIPVLVVNRERVNKRYVPDYKHVGGELSTTFVQSGEKYVFDERFVSAELLNGETSLAVFYSPSYLNIESVARPGSVAITVNGGIFVRDDRRRRNPPSHFSFWDSSPIYGKPRYTETRFFEDLMVDMVKGRKDDMCLPFQIREDVIKSSKHFPISQ